MVIWGAVISDVVEKLNDVTREISGSFKIVSNQCADVTCLPVSHNELIWLVAGVSAGSWLHLLLVLHRTSVSVNVFNGIIPALIHTASVTLPPWLSPHLSAS